MSLMTENEILALANEAGLWMSSVERIEAVKRFAELVAAKEREECAKVCDYLSNRDYGVYGQDAENRDNEASRQCAELIRARGEK